MRQIYAVDGHAIELLANIRSNMLEGAVVSGQMTGTPAARKARLLKSGDDYLRAAADS